MTLQTIADRVGVSRMTVSNAFSRPDQLSPELRQRILSAADDLGYVGPDPAARALARGRTGAVGVLLTDSLRDAFSDEVATTFLAAIADELEPSGLALTLLSSGRGDIVPARDVPMDGAFVYSCDTNSPGVEWLRRRKLPVVFVDHAPVDGAPSINIDDRSGARAAAEHIVQLGHRRVGILTACFNGPHGLVADPVSATGGHVATQRMLGWLDALEPVGIRPAVVQLPNGEEHFGFDGARSLLDGDERPTALLCCSDAIAAGAVRAADSLGLQVPGDVSIVGFDDSLLAVRIRPALTTVRQDVEAKGRIATSVLITQIENVRAGIVTTP
ncbi:MAG TPA: LacI family DNA-binding transcriptional regulator, partial [Ilumatobacteraceae bacterium]|nr:LacI family DNA-binding transcriptional regulator [Ilumatobacteraceae bacterium]